MIAFGRSPKREISDFKPPFSCGNVPLWKRLQEITSMKNQECCPERRFNVKLWLLSCNSHWEKGTPTEKTGVVSTRRWVPTSRVSGKMLLPSTEPVVTNVSVPSDFLVKGQVNGLATVQPLLTQNFVSTWLHSLLKRKTLSSSMNGPRKREEWNQLPTFIALAETPTTYW